MGFFGQYKGHQQPSCRCKQAIGDEEGEEDLVRHLGGVVRYGLSRCLSKTAEFPELGILDEGRCQNRNKSKNTKIRLTLGLKRQSSSRSKKKAHPSGLCQQSRRKREVISGSMTAIFTGVNASCDAWFDMICFGDLLVDFGHGRFQNCFTILNA